MDIPYLVHEVHSSELRAFLECRQSWFWQYRERWEPYRLPRALEFGKAWHAALEELYRPELWPGNKKRDLYERALEAYDREIVFQQAEYLDKTHKTVLEPEYSEEFTDRRELARNMLKNLIRSLDITEYTPIAVEQEFAIDLGMRCKCKQCWDRYWVAEVETVDPRDKYSPDKAWDPKNTTWIGLPVVLVVRIDAIFQDRKGSWWIVDHKSAAVLMADEDADYLEIDLQMGHYIWVLRRLGHPACGAIYNQFRKAYPKPPQELVSGGYSVNRNQLTDYWTALRTFKKDRRGYAVGYYDEYLEWLKKNGKVFFKAFKVFKTDEQLDMIERNLRLTVIDMLDAGFQGERQVYISPSKFICTHCDFLHPCLAKQGGHSYFDELSSSFVKTLPWYEVNRQRQKERGNDRDTPAHGNHPSHP